MDKRMTAENRIKYALRYFDEVFRIGVDNHG